MSLLASRVLTVSIAAPFDRVYDFAHVPENFPVWASGLGSGLTPGGKDVYIAAGSDGPVEIRFSPPNAYGVLDHTVTLGNGEVVEVPLRVVTNGEGCDVQLTLFRQPVMDDAAFERDATLIAADLAALKAVFEA
jgi:hypothetical protein